MQAAPPVTNLKKLLENYVRQATNAYPVCVFEVLCWAASEERASMDSATADDIFTQKQSSPDIVIPFMMQIDIGFRTQIEQTRIAPLLQAATNQSIRANYEASLSSIKVSTALLFLALICSLALSSCRSGYRRRPQIPVQSSGAVSVVRTLLYDSRRFHRSGER
jgi:hypothetical protein